MTPEQITKWADAAEMYFALPSKSEVRLTTPEKLQTFANLVRNAALEEAAKLCDGMQPIPASEPRHCAQDIRSLKT
jgi:hypothetical protein